MKFKSLCWFSGLLIVLSQSTVADDKQQLAQLLLGKEVRSLLDLPATKEGIDIYYVPSTNKRSDERGLDLGDLTKWLKDKGVGVEAREWELITNVIVGNDKIELHLGGGGQGRRGSKHASDVSPTQRRAGGSRINFRYGTNLTSADLQPEAFLRFAERVLDVSEIRSFLEKQKLPAEIRNAIDANRIVEGMTYRLVLMSAGEPEQKRIRDNTGGQFEETWYYMKDGRRWIVDFVNGKVARVQVY